MSGVFQCSKCLPTCILVAQDDNEPNYCPFHGANLEKANIPAEWRQIA